MADNKTITVLGERLQLQQFTIHAPGILDFVPRGEQLFDGNPAGDPARDHAVIDAARAQSVSFYMATCGLGADFDETPSEVRDAYLDLLCLWDESDAHRGAWAANRHDSHSSSCGLYVRSIWKLLGARTVNTTKVSGTLGKDRNISPEPLAGSLPSEAGIKCLIDFAEGCGATVELVSVFRDPSRFRPRKADVLVFWRPGKNHVISLIEDPLLSSDRKTMTWVSIDGGQGHSDGDEIHFGNCMGIKKRVRTYTFSTMRWTEERGEDDRQLAAWIRFEKLRFDAPIVQPVLNAANEPRLRQMRAALAPPTPPGGPGPSLGPTGPAPAPPASSGLGH